MSLIFVVRVVHEHVLYFGITDEGNDVLRFPVFGLIPAGEMLHSRAEEAWTFKGKVFRGFFTCAAEAARCVWEADAVFEMSVSHEITEACYPLDAES